MNGGPDRHDCRGLKTSKRRVRMGGTVEIHKKKSCIVNSTGFFFLFVVVVLDFCGGQTNASQLNRSGMG